MHNFRLNVAVFALAASLPVTAAADESDIGFSGKVGTLGLGAELSIPLSQTLEIRAGLNSFRYQRQERFSNIEYDFALDLRSASLLLDWHPSNGGFRLGGGMMFNGNEGQAIAQPVDNYRIGDFSFAAEQVGSLTADVRFEEYAPYMGLGWDGSFGARSRFGVSLDLGILYHGEPRVELTADGELSGDPVFEQELARELTDLEADVAEYRYYPVGSIGLTYRF